MIDISFVKLFKLHVEGTEAKGLVVDKTILLCNVTKAVAKACKLKSEKIYINTKVLKHLYDKKPAEEFDFIIHNLQTIAKYPDTIYKNIESKRGSFIFVKELKNDKYLCSIEIVDNFKINEVIEDANFIATSFRVRNENYLKKYELMWSWKDGRPSS